MMQKLHELLSKLIKTNERGDIETTISNNIEEYLKLSKLDYGDICKNSFIRDSNFVVLETSSIQWKFLTVLSFSLLDIADNLVQNPDDLLSVNFQKSLKASLEFVVSMGILPSLIPGVGIPLDKRIEFYHLYKNEELSPMEKYERLKSMTNVVENICKASNIKAIIYANFFKDYLAALFQLSYAPIVKPGTTKLYDDSEFTMTEQLFCQLKLEQKHYKNVLDNVIANCYRPLLIKELLLLQGCKDPPPPQFLKRVLSRELSNILISNDGFLSTMQCFFVSTNIDIGKQWKHIDTIKKLISVKHGSLSTEEYLRNICDQMKSIINQEGSNDYILVIASCIAGLYEQYPEDTSILEVINFIISPLMLKDDEKYTSGILVLSESEVRKLVKSLELCFGLPKLCLPSKLMTPIIYNIFGIRTMCKKQCMKTELNNILLKHFMSKNCHRNDWFDTVVFKKSHKHIITNNNFVFETISEGVQIKYVLNSENISAETAVNCILEIIEEQKDIKDFAYAFYIFCLTSLMSYSKINKHSPSKELLIHEDNIHDLISKESEHSLILLKSLEKLTSMKIVFDAIKNDPGSIVEFIISFLKQYKQSIDEGRSFENEECIAISLTLLLALLSDSANKKHLQTNVKNINSLLESIIKKSSREDIVFLCNEIKNSLIQNQDLESNEDSEFEIAISEVCDPMLPVRAHGLMHLTKLIDEKNTEALSKKHYIQCIFEENLKSDDSYVYLTAINGLAAMANYSAEDILEVLTREFLNLSTELKGSEDENECIKIRMKIGEVLVKVTKNLGDFAAMHKTLLLNTFLCGCKDFDELMRASSLSNLAEVSRVLSYNLGPVLYEMLNCINSILETDKSQECRRAAVLVVSSLLKGLGREALYFLREALLPIYRTLKKLYNNESEDHAVRLHAQIALEELNNIVRGMIFSPVKMEKEIFVIDKP